MILNPLLIRAGPMSIPIKCSSCGRSFRVKDEFAGRSGRCPVCGKSVAVPDPSQQHALTATPDVPAAAVSTPKAQRQQTGSDSHPRSAKALMREILSAFHGDFPRVRPTLLYRFGVLVVAATMLLLPVIYVALVGAVAWGVYYHATENLWILRRFGRLSLLLYFVPLLAGILLLPFLLKPLFARPSRAQKKRELRVTDEPLVHSFVQRLCEAVGAPVPRRIEVDCAVNASAGFRGGVLSMLSRDLVLTLGLPLAAGMNTRQLAGVLAHELGHFSQGAGMRVQYVVRAVNGWFYRVVYGEDMWDDFFDELTDDEHGALLLIFVGWPVRALVGVSRGILWVLMVTGHAVSCFMSRQMEFDADRYQARLAGSEAFPGTMRRVQQLSVAESVAGYLLTEDSWGGPLPPDFPSFIAEMSDELPPKARKIVRQLLDDETQAWFSTHPTCKARMAAAARDKAPGIFHLEVPARLLFRDFAEVGASISPRFYERALAMTALPGGRTHRSAAVQG